MTTTPKVIQRAKQNIRYLRQARAFAVSGHADGQIVEQDMRKNLQEAAASMEELVTWVETELARERATRQALRLGARYSRDILTDRKTDH